MRPCAIASSGFSGVTDLGQPHPVARIRQHVDQIVVALHLAVRHAAGEDHAIGEAALGGERLQRRLLRSRRRPAAAADRGRRGSQQRGGFDQQVEALVGVERAGEAEHRRAVEAESPCAARRRARRRTGSRRCRPHWGSR